MDETEGGNGGGHAGAMNETQRGNEGGHEEAMNGANPTAQPMATSSV